MTNSPQPAFPRMPQPIGGVTATAAAQVAVMRALVVAAHPDYEALALDELARAGFQYESRLVTDIDALRDLVGMIGVEDAWDIVLLIDTPDGPPVEAALSAFEGRISETPVIVIGRGSTFDTPPGLSSVRGVDLRSLSGAAADALREIASSRERRRGAQALRASEIRFAAAFESAPIGLALIRLDGRFVDVNPVFCRIAGLDRDDVVGVPPASLADDDVLACVLAASTRVSDGEATEPVERRAVRHDGTPVWVRVSASAARGDVGEILYHVVHVEDVTARRDAEEARERSEELFRIFFESTNVGTCIVDGAGHFVQTNRAYRDLLGYTAAELEHLTFADITHPDDVQANVSLRNVRLDEGAGYRMEKRYVRKDGTPVWVELAGAPLIDAHGNKLAIGVVVDITDRKAAENALHESVRVLETARSLFGFGSWIARRGRDGGEPELAWSPEMFTVLGLDPAAGPPSLALLQAAIHPDDRQTERSAMAAALAGHGRLDVSFRVVGPGGEERLVRACADVYAESDGSSRVVGLVFPVDAPAADA